MSPLVGRPFDLPKNSLSYMHVPVLAASATARTDKDNTRLPLHFVLRRPGEWSPGAAITFIVTPRGEPVCHYRGVRRGMSRKSAYARKARDPASAAAWEAALNARAPLRWFHSVAVQNPSPRGRQLRQLRQPNSGPRAPRIRARTRGIAAFAAFRGRRCESLMRHSSPLFWGLYTLHTHQNRLDRLQRGV
jgi:hypothetical protein